MIQFITPQETRRRLDAGEIRLIDIRETGEYETASIPGSESVPLSIIHKHRLWHGDATSDVKPIVFMCYSGTRTKNAQALLDRLAKGNGFIMEGGLKAWEAAGLPEERQAHSPLPIFRQIQMIAGFLVLAGVIGSLFWPPLIWLSGFIGAGLLFAGITGFCGMGILLSNMPWNRHSSNNPS